MKATPFLTPRSVTLLFLAVFVTGCAAGPDYGMPKTKVPETFANAADAGRTTQSSDQLGKWWTTLGDPMLNSLIDLAARQNLDLQLAQARVREARAQRGIVRADLFPDVNVSGSYQRNRFSSNSTFPQDATGSGSPDNLDSDLYQVGFDASWELDIFGGNRRAVEAATADIAAEIENTRDVLVTLLAEVARNYVELRTSQRQAAIARSNLDAQQKTLELTQVRFEAGLASDLDVSRARAQVETTAAQIPAFEISTRQSIHLLSVLLGQEPNALAEQLTMERAIPSTSLQIPTGLPSDLLRRRPDIRRAERQLAAATARIGVATADLFPRFSIGAALGLSSTKLSDLGDSGSRFWSIIPGVSLPIFNRGRIHSNIAVQNAREEQAWIIYEQTVLNSLREVEDALVALNHDQARRNTLAAAVDSNRRAVELANDLYQEGLADFLSVLQAQRDLYAAEDALAQGDRNITSDFVALYKALGGGWEAGATDAIVPPQGKPGERVADVTSRRK